jgi:prepilin-type N-terminal cleavage/methylation domain-containing protein
MKKTSKKAESSGFTLIEIIASVTIILLFFGLSIAGISGLQKRQALLTSGQNLKNALRDTQSRANNSEYDPVICEGGVKTDLSRNAWYFDLDSRKMYGVCRGKSSIPVPYPTYNLQEFKIDSKITIVPITTPAVTPPVISFFNNPPRTDTKGVICLNSADVTDMYYVIYITNSGSISDEGGLVTVCPTPF